MTTTPGRPTTAPAAEDDPGGRPATSAGRAGASGGRPRNRAGRSVLRPAAPIAWRPRPVTSPPGRAPGRGARRGPGGSRSARAGPAGERVERRRARGPRRGGAAAARRARRPLGAPRVGSRPASCQPDAPPRPTQPAMRGPMTAGVSAPSACPNPAKLPVFARARRGRAERPPVLDPEKYGSRSPCTISNGVGAIRPHHHDRPLRRHAPAAADPGTQRLLGQPAAGRRLQQPVHPAHRHGVPDEPARRRAHADHRVDRLAGASPVVLGEAPRAAAPPRRPSRSRPSPPAGSRPPGPSGPWRPRPAPRGRPRWCGPRTGRGHGSRTSLPRRPGEPAPPGGRAGRATVTVKPCASTMARSRSSPSLGSGDVHPDQPHAVRGSYLDRFHPGYPSASSRRRLSRSARDDEWRRSWISC